MNRPFLRGFAGATAFFGLLAILSLFVINQEPLNAQPSPRSLPSMKEVRSDFDVTLTELLESAQATQDNSEQSKESIEDIQSTLDNHSITLGRILSELEVLSNIPIIEPPQEPEQVEEATTYEEDNLAQAEEPPMGDIPESSIAGRAILSRYRGNSWHFKDGQGRSSKALLIGHLVTHGMSREGLESFSWADLRKIHGALHTEEQAQNQYASRSMINRPKSPQVIYRSSPPVVRYSTAPTVRYQSNCPNGRCPARRIYR